jgi:hypothetical protein
VSLKLIKEPVNCPFGSRVIPKVVSLIFIDKSTSDIFVEDKDNDFVMPALLPLAKGFGGIGGCAPEGTGGALRGVVGIGGNGWEGGGGWEEVDWIREGEDGDWGIGGGGRGVVGVLAARLMSGLEEGEELVGIGGGGRGTEKDFDFPALKAWAAASLVASIG